MSSNEPFPISVAHQNFAGDGGEGSGVSYRQWLIGMAMQGLLARQQWSKPDDVATEAIAQADGIIAYLDNERLAATQSPEVMPAPEDEPVAPGTDDDSIPF